MFQQLINDSDWANFNKQDFDEAMFTIFSTVLEHALKKRATRETVFIRNDKSDIIFHQKWMTEETRNFYQQTNSRMSPKDIKCQKLQNDFVERFSASFLDNQTLSFNILSKDMDKWIFDK